jgi:hypothetical protein
VSTISQRRCLVSAAHIPPLDWAEEGARTMRFISFAYVAAAPRGLRVQAQRVKLYST